MCTCSAPRTSLSSCFYQPHSQDADLRDLKDFAATAGTTCRAQLRLELSPSEFKLETAKTLAVVCHRFKNFSSILGVCKFCKNGRIFPNVKEEEGGKILKANFYLQLTDDMFPL